MHSCGHEETPGMRRWSSLGSCRREGIQTPWDRVGRGRTVGDKLLRE